MFEGTGIHGNTDSSFFLVSNRVGRERDIYEIDLDTGLAMRRSPSLLAPWNARFVAVSRATHCIKRLSTGLTTGIRLQAGDEISAFVSISKSIQWPTRSPIQWVPGAVSPGVKRLQRKAHHSILKSRWLEFMEVYHHAPHTSIA
jgi:hypothetical protein